MQYRNINSERRGSFGGNKPLPVRSDRMRAEEIDRERRQSGWNPYEGDEEEESVKPFFTQPDFSQEMEEQMKQERDLRALQAMYPEAAKLLLPLVEEECDKMEYEGSPMFDSYPDQTTIWRIQERIKKQAQQQMNGQMPKEQEMSGRMTGKQQMNGQMPEEQEINGQMAGEQPDAAWRRSDDGEDAWQSMTEPEMPEVFSMQYQGRRRGRAGQDWLGDMIRVMLLQEMHHRRCRHGRCRRRRY